MNNREEILIAIKTIMIKIFVIDKETITLEAHLYEDSINAVDMTSPA